MSNTIGRCFLSFTAQPCFDHLFQILSLKKQFKNNYTIYASGNEIFKIIDSKKAFAIMLQLNLNF